MTFSTMLNRLKGIPCRIAFRKCWDHDKWVFIGMGPNDRQVLYLHDGIYSDPYSVQQSDLFMSDWEVEDG